jgi:hypothetical protein
MKTALEAKRCFFILSLGGGSCVLALTPYGKRA